MHHTLQLTKDVFRQFIFQRTNLNPWKGEHLILTAIDKDNDNKEALSVKCNLLIKIFQ